MRRVLGRAPLGHRAVRVARVAERRCGHGFVTAAHALEDPFVGEFHKSEEEPDFPGGPVKIAVDDNTKLSAQDYRNNLYMQIQQIKREANARAAKAAAPAPAAAGAVQQEGAAPAP